MFANPDFAFPGRKSFPASSSSNTDNTTIPNATRSSHANRSSMHSRQISQSASSVQSSPPSPVRPMSRPASGSHHRRRSSVSSRRESREMMGIAINDTSDEPTNGVDQRQRALWALEGKKSSPVNTLMLGFSKVELPDWNTPDIEKDDFQWSASSSSSSGSFSSGSSSKHSHTPITPSTGGNPFSFSLNTALANKRDSFGKSLAAQANALKAELHTLLEEDEEEEEEGEEAATRTEENKEDRVFVEEPEALPSFDYEDDEEEEDAEAEADMTATAGQIPVPTTPNARSGPMSITPRTPSVIPASPSTVGDPVSDLRTSPTRTRPPGLTLRPLSLVSALPSPTPTISPSPRLKSLTLATNLQSSSSNNNNNQSNNSNVATPPSFTNKNGRRHSLLTLGSTPLTPSPSPIAHSMSALERQQRRQSSIGYRREQENNTPSRRSNRQSLPITPGLTPTSAVSQVTTRSVSPTTPSDSFSSSRASSEFFHTQAVSSLLSRIASLEEALQTAATSPATSKHGSLPLTPDSSQQSSPSADRQCQHPATDEFISVIADLKSERDELNSDINGWRTRCGDLERSCDIFGRRLAEERRELWAVQDRVGVLDAEVQASKSVQTRLEADLSLERTAMEVERKAKLALEESTNQERADWAKEQMKYDAERLRAGKERRAMESERELFSDEMRMLEDSLAKKEQVIKSLERRLEDSLQAIERMRATPTVGDLSMTPKAKGPWNGGAGSRVFSFPRPLPTSGEEDVDGDPLEYTNNFPAIAESPSQPTFTQGPGALNTGFKFGGKPPAQVAPRAESPKVVSPTIVRSSIVSPTEKGFTLGVVAEEAEEDEDEDEDELQSYEDEEDGDADMSFEGHGSDESFTDHSNAFHAIPAPAPPAPQQSYSVSIASAPVAPSQPAQHSHRRSASMIQKWRFPAPPTPSRRKAPTSHTMADPFFACLQTEDAKAPQIAVIGKQMKTKEHKKLPSGCPAFWLDADESDGLVLSSRAVAPLPLPSPAITEEEDNGSMNTAVETESEGESDLPRRQSNSSPPLPFPLVARPVAAQPLQPTPTPAKTLVVAPVTRMASPAVTRVSLTRPPAAASPTRSRFFGAPSFVPAPVSPIKSPLTTVPPAATAAMAVPPTLRVNGIASPSSRPASVFDTPSTPSGAASSILPVASLLSQAPSAFTSRFQTLSSMISWSPSAKPLPAVPDSEDEDSSQHTPSASVASPSSPAKTKLVDPSVMRERLRVRLERDGRLSASAPRSCAGPNETEPCGKCSATNVVEL